MKYNFLTDRIIRGKASLRKHDKKQLYKAQKEKVEISLELAKVRLELGKTETTLKSEIKSLSPLSHRLLINHKH